MWISIGAASVRDLVKSDGRDYSEDEIRAEVTAKCRIDSDGHIRIAPDTYAAWPTIWTDWNEVLEAIPRRILEVARRKPLYAIDYGPAERMMRAMGWQGGGLGVGETGRKTPILTLVPVEADIGRIPRERRSPRFGGHCSAIPGSQDLGIATPGSPEA